LTGFVAEAQDWASVWLCRRAGKARHRVSRHRLCEKIADFWPVFEKFAETGMRRGEAPGTTGAMASRLL
jgi:hypothetical protein